MTLPTTTPVRSSAGRFGGRGGQAALFATLSLTVLFGTLGFATDLGWDYFLKSRVQTAADSGANAAAVYAMHNGDTCSTVTCGTAYTCASVSPPVNSLEAGCLYAIVDGPPVLTATMIENNAAHPPSGLNGVVPTMWIQTTVTASNSNHFLFLSGFHTASIQASSIAGINTTAGTGNGSCLYALSASGTGITYSGSGNITTSCGISDNSALSDSGSGNIKATCATGSCPIIVNGNLTFSGSGQIKSSTSIAYGGTYSKTGSGSVAPAPAHGTTTITDPFANVTPPNVGSCTHTNFTFSGSGSNPMTPGTYCGGISLSGSGATTFATGTYIINGTDAGGKSFDYTGSGNISGTNVTFFITGQNGYTAGPINISGSGETFSAPSTGPYAGLLFYQDPGVTYAAANTYSGSGNVTGSLYFPTTTLDYSGSGNALSQALVANQIVFTGSGNFTQDTTGQYTGINRPVSTVSLLQ